MCIRDRRSLPGNYTWWAVQYGRFLLRDAMLSAVHAVFMCLSVRLFVSVCVSVCHTPVLYEKRRITQIMPHGKPGTLFFKLYVL